jgi:hypothetical protein
MALGRGESHVICLGLPRVHKDLRLFLVLSVWIEE